MKTFKYFLGLCLLLLFGCTAEKDVTDVQPDTPSFRFRQENLQTLLNGANLPESILSKLRTTNPHARNASIVEVDTSVVNIFELENGAKTFTFSVNHNSQKNKLFNYIVRQRASNEFTQYVVEYTLDTDLDQINPENLVPHIIDKEIFEVEGIEGAFNNTARPNMLCIQVGTFLEVDKCNGELVTPQEDPKCFNADGTRATKEIFVLIASSCGYGGEGSSDGGGGGSTGTGGGSSAGGGGGGGIPSTGGNSGSYPIGVPGKDEPVLTTPTLSINKVEAKLLSLLDSQQRLWWDLTANQYNKALVLSYLEQNKYSPESYINALSFVHNLIELASNSLTEENNAFSFMLNAQIQDKIYNDVDEEFLLSVDQFMEADVAMDPIHFQMEFAMKCAILRNAHPSWSSWKIYWEASKEMVHLALDVVGLVPVGGELADLLNGVLYVIEGDGVNATLSVASAVPFAGWAPTGTKLGLKLINGVTTASDIVSRVKLVWTVKNGFVTFGHSYQLRAVLGITADYLRAHHIIPWALFDHPVVQKAALSQNAFHLNEAINGIGLDKVLHNGSHPAYSNKIREKLRNFIMTNPNATPDQCYTKITQIIQEVRIAIHNNPTTHINQLQF